MIGGGNPEEGELIEVVELSYDQVRQYVSRPEVLSPPGFLFTIYWFFMHVLQESRASIVLLHPDEVAVRLQGRRVAGPEAHQSGALSPGQAEPVYQPDPARADDIVVVVA
ncbi:Uridine diphosphate glucose pyrophosphatase [Amphibalanus amphitrite]|uniref:Uridine diphosphate glucose pyrophosphatase n=1 Tax=Amphibalanus amphitrite TaxID=1232801 RepID=A0A6A4XG99_AMPAM|nr:Uridine diphosphate glucose pyrophosphatase [Amphibalanus amphitrite]